MRKVVDKTEYDVTMSPADLAAAAAQFDEEQEYERNVAEQIEIAAVAWRQVWPNHCTACKGWGGSAYKEMHGFRYGNGESMFDQCEATASPTTCHRCGKDGLSEDGEGPCKHCAWEYDDGVPQY